jgi:hypothetical protein
MACSIRHQTLLDHAPTACVAQIRSRTAGHSAKHRTSKQDRLRRFKPHSTLGYHPPASESFVPMGPQPTMHQHFPDRLVGALQEAFLPDRRNVVLKQAPLTTSLTRTLATITCRLAKSFASGGGRHSAGLQSLAMNVPSEQATCAAFLGCCSVMRNQRTETRQIACPTQARNSVGSARVA